MRPFQWLPILLFAGVCAFPVQGAESDKQYSEENLLKNLWKEAHPNDPVMVAPAAPAAEDASSAAQPKTDRPEAQRVVYDRSEKITNRYHLGISMAGFDDALKPDQEFRLVRMPNGEGGILLNPEAFTPARTQYHQAAYLAYALFRAKASYHYRSHFDAAEGRWRLDNNDSSAQLLSRVLQESANWSGARDGLSARDQDYREALSKDTSATVYEHLARQALFAIEERAADEWALQKYEREIGPAPKVIRERIEEREKNLAAQFGRARFAMTSDERVAFRDIVNRPVSYGVAYPILSLQTPAANPTPARPAVAR